MKKLLAVFFGLVLVACGNSQQNNPDVAKKVPKGLVASSGARTVELSWSGLPGASGYTVYWTNNPNVSPLSGEAIATDIPYYVHSPLNNGMAYYYVVTATLASGETGPSNRVVGYPKADVPEKPAVFNAQAGDRRVTLTFDTVPGASKYHLYWSTQAGTNLSSYKIENIQSPFVHSSLQNGTTYFYTLRAENDRGISNASIEINAQPRINPPTAPVMLAPTAVVGQVTLRWENLANASDFKLYWGRNPGVTSNDAYISHVSSPFVHAPLSTQAGDNYYYRVQAINSGGVSALSNEVHITTPDQFQVGDAGVPPSAPVNLATAILSNQITLDWQSGAGSESLGYNIYWKKGGATIDAGLQLDNTSNNYDGVISNVKAPYTHIGLENGIYYYYRVSAINNAGESPLTSIVYAAPEMVRFGVPAGLSVVAGDQSVALSWIPVDQAQQYDVQLDQLAPVTSADTRYVFSNLNNYQTYTLKVRVHSASNNDWSNEISAVPKDPAPNAPQNVIAVSQNKQVQVRWKAAQPVNASDSNEAIVDYVVYMGNSEVLTPDNGKQVAVVTASGAADEQTVIANLNNGSRYYFVVTARNIGGESLSSNLAWAIPQTPIPNAPTDLGAEAGDNQVTLTFTPLPTTGITYNLYWNKETVSGRSPTQVIVNISNNYVFTDGQANGTMYYFRIAAVSAGGESVLSNEVSAKPQVPAPQSAPQNVVALAKSAQVSLSWDAVAGASAYELFWSTGAVDVNTSASIRLPASSNSYEQLGLSNGLTYYYLIRAVNPGGNGPLSNLISAYPQVDPPLLPRDFVALAGDASVSLNWTTAADATSYELYWTDNLADSLTNNIANIDKWRKISGVRPGYVHDTLSNGKTYLYSLKALNPGGSSAPVAEQTATPQLAAPAKPLGLAVASADQSVAINWYSEAGLSYSLYWSSGDPNTNSPLTSGNVINNASPIYLLNALTNGVQYNFQIVAHNAGPNPSVASNIVSATPQQPQSGAPEALSAEAGDGEVTLRWNQPAGALAGTQYTLYWSDNSSVLSQPSNATAIANVSSPFVHSGRANGQTYYYVVTATEPGALEGPPSNLASAKPVPPIPAAPTSIVLLPGDSQINVSWGAVAGAANYLVEWSFSGAFDEGLSTTINAPATQYIHSGLSNGTTVSYRISSQNISGTGAGSVIVSAAPVSSQPPINQAPLASNVTISDNNGGVLLLGTTLYVNYTYSDAENDAEGLTKFQWYRASTAISGANQSSYSLTRSDVGQAISVDVTPVALSGTSPGQTQRASVNSVNTPPQALNVAIVDQNGGAAVVGDVLNGQYTYYDLENDSEGNTGFLWLRDGLPITAAISRNYTVTAADSGHQLRFQVRPQAVSGDTQGAVVESAPISVINSAPSASNLLISDGNGNGIAVGDLLVASYVYNDLDGDLEGNSIYQWYRGATPIAGANGLNYSVSSADTGQTLVFEVTPVAATGASPGQAVNISATVGNSAPVASNVMITDINGAELHVGDTLQLSYTYFDADGDVESGSQLQWLRNGSVIANASALNYVVVAADSGASISARVTPAAATGTSPGVSATSAAIAVVNSVPSASNVQITDTNGGAVVVGDTLQGSYIFVDVDNDSEGVSTYQWFRNNVAITGATTSSYVLTAQDSGQTIRFEVTPIAASGANPGLAASASLSVGNTAPVASNVTITGNALVGNLLTASYIYSDVDGDVEGVSTFQWFRGATAIAGATTKNYTTVAADSGQTLRFEVTPVAATGTSPGAIASATIVIQNSAPVASNVAIAGTATVGNTLTGSYSYSDVDGDIEGVSNFQWYRGATAINGATATAYVVVAADSGQTLRFEVTPVAVTGVSLGAPVSASITGQNSAPTATNVAIAGTPSVGGILTGSYTYNDIDGDIEGVSTFQWFRGTSAITGANSTSYTVVAADSGQTLRFEVTPIAATGTSPGVPVSATINIQNSVPVANNVAITGTATVGNTLTGSYVYSDVDGDAEGVSTFQWFRGATAIAGATAKNYISVAADSGQTLRFEVTPVAATGASPGIAASATIIIQNSPPLATNVAITGSATVGNTLTGSYTYSDVDGDAEGISTFQWYRGGTAIAGATALSYLVVAADSGQTLRFEVTPVAATGVSPGAPASASTTGQNSAPSATNVSIAGTATVGNTLTGSYTYNDADGDAEGVTTFQWFRGATPITGAVATSYTVVAADSGQTLRFEVTPVAATGTSPGTPASATVIIQNSAPLANNVAIAGTATVGNTLTASYSYSDVDGDAEGTSTFQWFRGSTAINGATLLSYTTVAADSGQTLRFEVTPVAVAGTSPGTPASATIVIQNSAPLATNVAITGSATVGNTLTGSYVYSDVDGDAEGISTFQWFRGTTAITGATSTAYVVVAADSGQTLRFEVTPVAATGVSPGTPASASITGQNSAPSATNVAIAGNAIVGSLLTGSYAYSDADGDAEGVSTFQWFRGAAAITGATAITYTTVAADSGQTLRFQVTPVAATGTSPGVAASATLIIQNSAPSATNVAITGSATVGSVLTGSYTYNDVDGDAQGVSTFQWFRGAAAITGATATTYTTVAADSGQTLRFQVTPVAATGASPGALASATLIIQNSAPTATNVAIAGTATVGSVLTGSYTYNDVDGDAQGVSTFQWFRGAAAITGATATTYTTVAADSGQTLRFQVTPVAATGTSPGLAASASMTIQNSAPVASNVAITGTATVGNTLTGSYTYADADGDAEGASTFQWFRGATAIAGASAKTYTTVALDSGQTLRFQVTPVAATGTSPGAAASATVVIQNSPPVAALVSISGAPAVGATLLGSYTYQDADGDPQGATTFQWFRGTTAIAGATTTSYTTVVADLGQILYFQVTPVAATGASPGSAVSAQITIQNSVPVAGNPLISGAPNIGAVVNATFTYSDVDGDAAGVHIYQWYLAGVPVTAATASSYTVQASDAGKALSFSVTPVAATGASPGVMVTSASVVVNSPPLASSVSISGSPAINSVLTGNYSYSDADGDVEGVSTFQWLRGTTAISGATAKTYTVAAADSGQSLSFRVTPVAATGSSPGTPVLASISIANSPPSVSNVAITGTPNIGNTLSGSYVYSDIDGDLEGASILQWFSGTTLLGSGPNYTILSADAAKSIRFEVTPVASSGASPGTKVASANVLVNSPPTVSNVTIDNATKPGSTIFVLQDQVVANYTYSDVDGDVENGTTFIWYIDGIVIPGVVNHSYTIQLADVGHNITVDVIPGAFTGSTPGAAVRGPTITVTNQAPSGAVVIQDTTNPGGYKVGDTFHANFGYLDPENDPPGTHTYQWYRNSVAITGATAVDYITSAADQLASITVGVVPHATLGTLVGNEVLSAAVTVNAATLTTNLLSVSNGYLFNINSASGQMTRVSGAGLAGYNDIRYSSYDYVNHVLYAVNFLAPIYPLSGENNAQLLKIDPLTGATTIVNFDIHWKLAKGIAVDSSNGLLYMISNIDELWVYDLVNNTWKDYGLVGQSNLNELVINTLGDTLYSVTRNGGVSPDSLVAISTSTHLGSVIGSLNGSAITPLLNLSKVHLAYDTNKDQILAAVNYLTQGAAGLPPNSLVTIDKTTAAMTEIGSFRKLGNNDDFSSLVFAYNATTPTNSKLYYLQNAVGMTIGLMELMLPDYGGRKIQQIDNPFENTTILAYKKNAGVSGLAYAIDKYSAAVMSYDPLTYKISLLGKLSVDPSTLVALADDPSQTNLMYLVTLEGGAAYHYYSLNLLDLSLTQKAVMDAASGCGPYYALKDLAYHPGNGKLYGIAHVNYTQAFIWDIDIVAGTCTANEVLGLAINAVKGLGVAESVGPAGPVYSVYVEDGANGFYTIDVGAISGTAAVTAAAYPDPLAPPWKLPSLYSSNSEITFTGNQMLVLHDGNINSYDIGLQSLVLSVNYTYTSTGYANNMAVRYSVANNTSTIYSVSQGGPQGSDLFITDRVTGLEQLVGNIGFSVDRLSYNPATDTMYGIGGNNVYTLDLSGTAPIGNLQNSVRLDTGLASLEDIAFDANGNCYALAKASSVSGSESFLYSVNLASVPVQMTPIAKLPDLGYRGLTYDTASNSLLTVIQSVNGQKDDLSAIAPSSGKISTLGELSIGNSTSLFKDIEYDPTTQTLYHPPLYRVYGTKTSIPSRYVAKIAMSGNGSYSYNALVYNSVNDNLLLFDERGNTMVSVNKSNGETTTKLPLVYSNPIFLIQDDTQPTPVLYGLQSTGWALNLFSYDASTGLTQSLASLPYVRSLDASFDPSEGTNDTIYTTDGTNLHSISKTARVFSAAIPYVYPVINGSSYGIEGIEIDNTGQMFGLWSVNMGGIPQYYLVKVNKLDGTVTQLANPIATGIGRANSMTYDKLANKFYTVDATNGQLIRLDPLTGSATVVGSLPPNVNFMSVDPNTLANYATSLKLYDANVSVQEYKQRFVYQIDPLTGNSTYMLGPVIGELVNFYNDPKYLPINGLAFDPSATTPQFYGIDDEVSPYLVRFDSASATTTRIAPMTINSNPGLRYSGLAWNTLNNSLYGLSVDPLTLQTQLFSFTDIALATGKAVNAAVSLGNARYRSLQYVAKDNVFIAIANNSYLITIDPASGGLLNTITLPIDAPSVYALTPLP